MRRLVVAIGAASLVIFALSWTRPLTATDAVLIGVVAAIVGTLVIEHG